MYQVFDNGNPAEINEDGLSKYKWSQSKYATFKEAHDYANKWLGFGEDCGVVLELNKPWDYSGYGDMIEIRKVA